MNIKVHIPGKASHGILRVIEAQRKYLPQFGIELVDTIEEADVINTHGADRVPVAVTKPILNTNHGLYWSRYAWGKNYQEVNCMVIDAMVQAKAHTAPSEWVATSIRRGGLFYPEVVYHGVDADEWQPGTNEGYILWNKARADYVSNPVDMNELAKILLDYKFVSTLGKPATNVQILNTPKNGIPFAEMKRIIANAGLYLSTARETFGIGMQEAMACGVPVVGWNWGGQAEIVIHGVTGYLAEPGNYNQLADMVRLAFEHRQQLSDNCLQDVRERWGWEPRIKQYADIFKRLHNFYNVKSGPKVSVIVTAYNLDHYLPKCLDSVKEQTFDDFECIVVDDGLKDSTKAIVDDYAKSDDRFRYLRPEKNLGLPGARNFGHHHARGMFFRHLDADDWLHKNALSVEVSGLEADNSISIGYGPMMNVDADGNAIYDGNGAEQVWAHHEFSWRQQMSHINQIPSCCMVRREVFDRSGGYRTRMKKAEDAHFWCMVTSKGFRARKITNDITMYHRVHKDSKGQKEWDRDKTDGDWTAWFPWRFGASTYSEGIDLLNKLGNKVPHSEIVPFSVDAPPPPDKQCWDVHDYSTPFASIIVTVGPGYEQYIHDCLDSIAAQNYPDWECIVVNDTGRRWPSGYWDSPLSGFPWAKEVSTGGNYGVSRARNLGAQHARGKVIIPFDVDDVWIPWFLEKMIAMYEENKGIIYSQVYFSENGEATLREYAEFDCGKIIHTGQYPGSSILIPKEVHDKIVEAQGGWDENIPGMEDWDYQIACHAFAGACAYRVEEPLFYYRIRPDGNREKHQSKLDDIVKFVNEKWRKYRIGEEKIMCGCKDKKIKSIPSSTLSSSSPASIAVDDSIPLENKTIDIEYLGNAVTINYRGPVNHSIIYRFGTQDSRRVKRVFVEDAKELLLMDNHGSPLFRIAGHAEITPDVRQFLMA